MKRVPLLESRSFVRLLMQGMKPLQLVSDGLGTIVLPPLSRPPVKPGEEPTRQLVLWGCTLYAYSVIVHVRTITAGIVELANAGNTPAVWILSRHVFEWAAHACYISWNLKNYLNRNEWGRAWKVLSKAAIGNLWAKQHGGKYAPDPQVKVDAPDPLAVSNLVAAYQQYQSQEFGTAEAQENYGLLSEHSHPNSVCLQQYHEYAPDGIHLRFGGPLGPSPLPIINWCLLDLLTFIETLLGMCGETAVRPHIVSVMTQLAKLAPSKRT